MISKIVRNIPIFGVLLVIYNIVMGINIYSFPESSFLDLNIFSMTLPSESTWSPTYGDILIVLGLLVLYIEILKSTRTSTSTVVEHTISLFIFIAYLVEFLLVSWVAHSSFLILGCMAMIDVIAGFTITISAARRDIALNDGDGGIIKM